MGVVDKVLRKKNGKKESWNVREFGGSGRDKK